MTFSSSASALVVGTTANELSSEVMRERQHVQTYMLHNAEETERDAIARYDVQLEYQQRQLEYQGMKEENVRKAEEKLEKAKIKVQKARDNLVEKRAVSNSGCFSYLFGRIPFSQRNRILVLDIIEAKKMFVHAAIRIDSAQENLKTAQEELTNADGVIKTANQSLEAIFKDVEAAHKKADTAHKYVEAAFVEKLAMLSGRVKCLRERCQSVAYAESAERSRKQEEKSQTIANVIAYTTPSSWNPWLSKLFAMLDRPADLCKRSAEHYSDCEIMENGAIIAKCKLTGVRGDSTVVALAHILPRNAAEHFLLQCDVNDVDHPRNTIFLCKNIEQAFNDQKLCFLMDEFTGNLILKILHNGTKDEVLFAGAPETIGLYDGKSMSFMEKQVPFTKALSLHSQTAYAMAKEKNWIKRDVPDPIMYGSPMSFDTITFTDAVPATDTRSTMTWESQMPGTFESEVA